MPFELSLSPDELRVPAGQSAEITVQVHNQDAAEQEYTLEVLGLDAAVFRIPEALLRLPPGGTGQLQVTLCPPAASNIRAASYPFRIRVTSRAREQQVAAARFTIEPAAALKLELTPAGGNRFDVRLHSEGNSELEVQLRVEEEGTTGAAHCDYDLDRATVRLRGGETAVVPLRVRPRARPFIGSTRSRPFTISAIPGTRGARGESLRGIARTAPLVPWWLLIVILLALAAGGFLVMHR